MLAKRARVEPEAFAALYQRYIEPVYRYCYVRLGAAEWAEDATARTFAKAFEGLGRYRGGAFAAWLYRIARNEMIDITRRRRPAALLDALPEPSDPAPGPEEEALARAEAETLRRAMDRLTEEQRAIIELQLAGWSGPQIADAVGKSPDAVKMQRYRAFRRLRELLGSQIDGGEDVRHDRA